METSLLFLGVLLILLGLLTGLGIGATKNPRMALSSHLEAVMNGMLLVLFGLLWPQLELADWAEGTTFGLAVYAAYANWVATLLASIWGAGRTMMPIASPDHEGSRLQERTIAGLLLSLSLAIIAATVFVLVGIAR